MLLTRVKSPVFDRLQLIKELKVVEILQMLTWFWRHMHALLKGFLQAVFSMKP